MIIIFIITIKNIYIVFILTNFYILLGDGFWKFCVLVSDKSKYSINVFIVISITLNSKFHDLPSQIFLCYLAIYIDSLKIVEERVYYINIRLFCKRK